MDLPSQFIFYIDSSPSFYHLASVRGSVVVVDWDKEYIEQNPCHEGWWDSAEVEIVKQWIAHGGWVVVGKHKQMTTGGESLQRSFTSLQMGFDALEEGFQSLRAAFEAVKRQVKQEG